MAKFTKEQLDAAVIVLMETPLVKNWCLGELRAYGIDRKSPDGRKFLLKKRRKIAERIIYGID